MGSLQTLRPQGNLSSSKVLLGLLQVSLPSRYVATVLRSRLRNPLDGLGRAVGVNFT